MAAPTITHAMAMARGLARNVGARGHSYSVVTGRSPGVASRRRRGRCQPRSRASDGAVAVPASSAARARSRRRHGGGGRERRSSRLLLVAIVRLIRLSPHPGFTETLTAFIPIGLDSLHDFARGAVVEYRWRPFVPAQEAINPDLSFCGWINHVRL